MLRTRSSQLTRPRPPVSRAAPRVLELRGAGDLVEWALTVPESS